MLEGKDILTVMNLLEQRRVTLYHACHLIDLESYFKLGGIPSRNLLETEKLAYTSFQTDQARPDDWVWNNVSLQLIDFGNPFARNCNNLPNKYGPILLEIDPAALKEAEGVAVCLRPGQPDDYIKDRLSVLKPEKVEHIFRYTQDAPFPEKTYFKPADQMAQTFGANLAVPEIHCRLKTERLPFDYVTQILVDNYRIVDHYLREWAFMIQQQYGNRIPIMQRYCPYDIGGKLTNALAKILTDESPSLEDLTRSDHDEVKSWAAFLSDNHLDTDFEQFAQGMQAGTIFPVKNNQLEVAMASGGAPKPLFNRQTRELINKLLAEKVPVDSIARIVDVKEEDIRTHIQRSS